MDCASICDSWK